MLCEFFLFDALMVDPVEPTAAETLLGWRKNNTQIEKKPYQNHNREIKKKNIVSIILAIFFFYFYLICFCWVFL